MKILSSLLFRSLFCAALLGAAAPRVVTAQGGDNPTGVAGVFGTVSTTGGSFSPYTANATRTIPDLTVAGAVGSYPLQWARIMNSRLPGVGVFGKGGGWRHSYEWTCSATDNVTSAPDAYKVNYPDGRSVTFDANIGTPYLSPAGVTDRMTPAIGSGYVYLNLTDGGKVRFYQTATFHHIDGDPDYWDFVIGLPDQIIDPHGNITTLTYDTSGCLIKVKEAAGRYLLISYGTNGYVSQVDSYTAANHWSQWVKYTYASQSFGGMPYVVLTKAEYIYTPGAEPAPIATYTYQTSNTSTTGNPLINVCRDVRYPGPMKNIAYGFVRTSPLSYGQLSQEKNANGTVVTTLTVNTTAKTRTETRPDGNFRVFTYGATLGTGGATKDYLLKTYTDFAGNLTTLSYDADGFVSSIKDANNHTTLYAHLNQGFPTGVISKITHPVTATENPGKTIQYFYTDATGAYLDHVIDERGKQTTYKRYTGTTPPYQTISETDYPDGGIEKYTYDSFGQVFTHTMPSNTATAGVGGVETYDHDASGKLTRYTPPITGSDPDPGAHPTTYTYDINDHLQTVTDPRGNVTTFYSNEIGQITIEQHDDTDNSQIGYTYNADGTLASKNAQLTATTWALTQNTYDDYKRLLTVTDPVGRVATLWYDKAGAGTVDLSHTDANASLRVLPAPSPSSSKRVTKTVYDANLRPSTVTIGNGTSDAATTSYNYDSVGNLTAVIDPMTRQTTYGYDGRDRLLSIDDPIATDRNSDGHTVTYAYDGAGNKTLERRANDQVITYDSYDERNRLTQMTVSQWPTANAVTEYTWTKAGQLDTMTDPGRGSAGSVYNYDYDKLNRPVTLTYPAGGGTETRLYDFAGNLTTFKNRAGQTQSLTYDTRNREQTSSWSSGNPQTRTLIYDDASRVKSCNTTNAFINFTYFSDGALKSQEVWGTGSYGDGVHRTINYTYDEDRNRASIAYPFLPAFEYNYTARNQLKQMTWSYDDSNVVSYSYDKNGNALTRVPGTNPGSSYGYDALNRVTNITHNFNGATRTLGYGYDKVGRRQYVQRDGGLADGYGYGFSEQVADFRLNGTVNLSTGAVSGGVLSHFDFDASGNRTSLASGGVSTAYTANGLNQYSTVGNLSPGYGALGNLSGYNGWSYTYDSQGRLISASKGATSATFFYDGLNRQVARSITAAGTTTITYSVWDGWNLVAEYGPGPVLRNRFIYAGNDLIRSPNPSGIYYYADAQGSTVFLGSDTGALVEQYTYDLYGAPTFYNGGGTQLPGGSLYDVEMLFTGQRRYDALGIYDLRNRAYHPGLGRFLQPDPIGFAGDPANLYRYCGNNPVNLSDPDGEDATKLPNGNYWYHAGPDFKNTAGGLVVNPNPRLSGQCAVGGQFLAGTVIGGSVFDVPPVRTWTQGNPVTTGTPVGTLVATGWQEGGYPGLSSADYHYTYGADATVNHTAIFSGVDPVTGEYVFYDQWSGKTTKVLGDTRGSAEGWYVVNGPKDHDGVPSQSRFVRVAGVDANTGEPIFEGTVAGINPFDSTNVNIFNFPSGAMTLAGAPGSGGVTKIIQP